MDQTTTTGKFVSKADIMTDRLEWGDLAWVSRPSFTGSQQITEALVTLAPGYGHDFHRHPRQEEVLYLLSGSLEQWLEGDKRMLQPGDAMFVPRGVVHASFNVGTEDARFLVVLSPSAGEAGYESEELASQSPWNTMRTRTPG
jgi:quercetin dioxygenase-like cupin family protein